MLFKMIEISDFAILARYANTSISTLFLLAEKGGKKR